MRERIEPARRVAATARPEANAGAAQARRGRLVTWSRLLPWLALILLLALPPLVWRQSWLLAYLAQTATMIVFALSYNLLLGETGLLSFGHAAYAGLGALIAAHVFNRFGVPLALLPLVGGAGAALCGALLGFISTRRAGTAFAMITLGIGELVAAAAWTLPDWFGGEAGVAIDRASGPAFGAWTFGPAREAYTLIALWCLLASVAMFALTRTPFMRVANAVRDNPVRAAAIGCYPRRIRYGVVVMSAFFAGVAGTLALINVELVSTESVSMLRSGSVLIATVIGGTGAFFGPVAGAVVLTFFSTAVASVTRAWLFYLGLFFVVIVVAAPDGLAGFLARHAARLVRYGWRSCRAVYLAGTAAFVLWSAAVVLAVQWAYAAQFDADQGAAFGSVFSVTLGPALGASGVASLLSFVGSSPTRLSLAIFALAACGTLAAFAARRAQHRFAAQARTQGPAQGPEQAPAQAAALHDSGDAR
ncbi:branched-chain amino acid ABC transporter permease [Paraburkholderia phenoliruptrix]|uniref:branched-chain amino acid ABC transporter permease n=1 Tax=Paraburkholderia phenoliruptrix TaxID=252970 RepID=UPI001C6DE0D8|nr:branched-chain amino acid ABC transporter permease [Paraburkholderia phenoliruptrix]MBW9106854.1 branched-chain amino acid ABC transporter permease [Paraburkholderia phenoliruptrix]MBW9132239.1 branched-chain amino acid ABC transporter permease [Paraburkholderia ginsengiterrae]